MKEKKQQDIKFRYIEHAGIEDFMSNSENTGTSMNGIENGFIDTLKKRIGRVKDVDVKVKEFKKKDKKERKELELFMSSSL